MISEQTILNAAILIVDDKPSNVLLLSEILQNAGFTRIASTTDPYAVCNLHRKNRYDLILLDLEMPGMDGFRVMEGLKEIETDGYIPVLVITAQPEHKQRALAAGAKDFVTKPFDLVEIRTRIHNMLEVRLLYTQIETYNKALEQTVLERTVELRDSEARFRRLTELSSDWYWEQDEKGCFTKVNGPVFEMLGITVDDAMVRFDQSGRWNPVDREALIANLAARRPFLDLVYRRENSDGSWRYLMVSGEPIFDISGRFRGYRGIGKDVTETMATNYQSPVTRQL